MFEQIIKEKLNEVFKNEDYHNFSLYERRKKIYDYLYNSLEFDFEELNNNCKDAVKQIKDVLINNRGICNSIIYVYKIMLEKVDVYSLALFCKDENDMHTVLLADNGNNTLSFDDVSIAIYSKQRKGFMLSPKDRFDYDLEDAKLMNQGTNEMYENIKYAVLPSKTVNYFFGKTDNDFINIKPSFLDERSSFATISDYISSNKKQNLDNKKIM